MNYSVSLDENNYYSGNYYYSMGELLMGEKVVCLPPNDNEKLWFAYKYENDGWILDVEKMLELQQKIVDEENNELIYEQLGDIKILLNNLDIKTMKFVDGDLTSEEYEPFRLQKAELRKQYNELETQLK